MSHINHFIIIDDDAINNALCRKIIEKTYVDAEITDFIDPQEGFDFIASRFADPATSDKAILLLDISMPVMSAWDFLELFEQLDERTKDRVKVHILSSSVNKRDMLRAQSDKNVEYYLIKPLTKESIRLIVHVLNRREGVV